VCDRGPHVAIDAKDLFKENQKVSELPKRIRSRLKNEAHTWDSCIAKEKPKEVSKLLDKSQLFVARRPPR